MQKRRNKEFVQDAALLMALNVNSYSDWRQVAVAIYGRLDSEQMRDYLRDVSNDLVNGNLIEFINLDVVINYCHEKYDNCFINGFVINVDDLPHIIKVNNRYYDDVLKRY